MMDRKVIDNYWKLRDSTYFLSRLSLFHKNHIPLHCGSLGRILWNLNGITFLDCNAKSCILPKQNLSLLEYKY